MGEDPGPEVPQLLPATFWGPLHAPRTSPGCWLWGCLGWAGGLYRAPHGLGMAQGLCWPFLHKGPADQADQASLPSGLQTAGHPWAPRLGSCRGGIDEPAMLACPSPGRAPPRTETAGGKGAERERSGGHCAGSEGGALEGSGGRRGRREAEGWWGKGGERPRVPAPWRPPGHVPIPSGRTVPSRKAHGGTAEDAREPEGVFHGEISETKAYFFRQDCLCSLLMAVPWPGARRPQTRSAGSSRPAVLICSPTSKQSFS